ncbi:MAG: glycosyltransferase [Muribaculaceae bacterium]|nr:glycosyltransferase [Muribaculaceae bacterium]
MKKISVIVPVYNCERYLRECLDSVLAQTHTALELIVADDGSTDGSAAIADAAAAADPRVRVVHGPNGGLSVARNRGIDIATGDYISFVDADDTIHPRMLAMLLEAAEAERAEVAVCRFSHRPLPREPRPGRKVLSGAAATEAFLYQHIAAGACVHLFAGGIFGSGLRFRPGILYEDLEFLPRAYACAARVAVCRAALYYYRPNPASIINTWSPRRLDVLRVTDGIERACAGEPRLLAAARDRRLSAAFNILMLNARNGRDADVRRACYDIIRERRRASLFNPRVRLKNKLGIAASLLGPRFLAMLSRL